MSPLATVARPGRFGAVKGAPGVQLSVQHPAAIVTVIARKGHAQELAMGLMELKDCAVRWAGFEQFYVVADARAEGALYDDVKAKLGTLASVSDQSHGRIILRIGGPKSRPVLTKGTPVDLNGDNFPIGKCAVTQMAHVGVHLARTGDETFELSVFRGFAESFWEWLTLQSEEYGYQVT
jgi:heterotetrameric sarcosine oxidase gamma subunit